MTVGELARILEATGLAPQRVVQLMGSLPPNQPISAEDAARILNRAGFVPVQTSVSEDDHVDAADVGLDDAPVAPRERYVDLGVIHTGTMGEVRRVLDRDLGRTMAMKILNPRAASRPETLARFIQEAQATSQLQHPGIAPIYELGQLANGRWYYTMREVKGRSLGAVIQEVHGASAGKQEWTSTHSGWSFRGLCHAFLRVCEVISYAHGRGVVHCDLKPSNVLVGDHGEVLVLDWGLAKVVARPNLVAEAGELDAHSQPDLELVASERARGQGSNQRGLSVAGSPPYMAPEAASGEISRVDVRSDVYSLGAILYEMLRGRPPHTGPAPDVLGAVLADPPQDQRAELPIPHDLREACRKAMSHRPADRFASASQLATAVEVGLEGGTDR